MRRHKRRHRRRHEGDAGDTKQCTNGDRGGDNGVGMKGKTGDV